MEWDSVTLHDGQPDALEVSVETVLDYLAKGEPLALRRSRSDDLTPSFEVSAEHVKRGEPLRDEASFDFDDYVEKIQRYGMGGALLGSQRPLVFSDSEWNLSSYGRVGSYHEPEDGGWRHLDGIDIVAVDLSGALDFDVVRERIKIARQFLLAPSEA